MASLSLLKVTVYRDGGAARSYFFKGNAAFYTGAIATATGITPAATTDKNEPVTLIGELLRVSVLIRVTGTVITARGPKSVKFLTAMDKLGATLALTNVTVPQGTLKSVYIARRAVRY
ncbi:MAG TPA: hypothetical protein VIQ31_09265 [Phormidium sp.]